MVNGWGLVISNIYIYFLDSQSSNSELQDKVITILQAEEYTKDFSVRNALNSYQYHQTRTCVHRLMSIPYLLLIL